jgi:hypothetical protein
MIDDAINPSDEGKFATAQQDAASASCKREDSNTSVARSRRRHAHAPRRNHRRRGPVRRDVEGYRSILEGQRSSAAPPSTLRCPFSPPAPRRRGR